MLRVLMVLEDYGELMFLQTVLKKLGFDVDAIQNSRLLADSLLRMNPDVVVMTAHGRRVRGVDLCRQIKRVRGLPRVLLMRAAGSAQEPDLPVEGWMVSPVSALNFLNTMADTCGLNKQMLAEKYQKLRMQEAPEDLDRAMIISGGPEPEMDKAIIISGKVDNVRPSTLAAKERKDRYDKAAKEKAPPKEAAFSAKAVAVQVRDLRKSENAADLEELERQRRLFVEHLFKKKA
jgi:CheY-like chemotaxis protein